MVFLSSVFDITPLRAGRIIFPAFAILLAVSFRRAEGHNS
jgi:hypothetical protein